MALELEYSDADQQPAKSSACGMWMQQANRSVIEILKCNRTDIAAKQQYSDGDRPDEET